jgi:hypothetical protein
MPQQKRPAEERSASEGVRPTRSILGFVQNLQLLVLSRDDGLQLGRATPDLGV